MRRVAQGGRFVVSHRGKPAARMEPLTGAPLSDPASDFFLSIASRRQAKNDAVEFTVETKIWIGGFP